MKSSLHRLASCGSSVREERLSNFFLSFLFVIESTVKRNLWWWYKFQRLRFSSRPFKSLVVLLCQSTHGSFLQRALVPRCWAVLLHGNRCIAAIADGADQLDGCMLQSIMIDEEALVKVSLTVHLLGVVLIDYSHIFDQVSLIKHSMDALWGPFKAIAVALNRLCIVNSLVSHGNVSWIGITLTLLIFHVIFKSTEAVEALFYLHLSRKIWKG